MLTSVGRRSYLVKFFKEIIKEHGKVHVSNSSDNSIAFKYADYSVVSPLIYDKNYIPFLLNYCKENKIDILISLFDIDLLVLAKNKEKFQKIGTKVIVSDQEIITICNDKWKTYQFLKTNGFNTPKSYLKTEQVIKEINCGKINYPIVVKPRYGCGSISIAKANNEEELKSLCKKVTIEIENTYLKYESEVAKDKVIFQECLSGQEYGADIINNLSGELQNVIVRKKVAMRSGETDIAQLVENSVIKQELEKLAKKTKHIANMDCDVFLVDGKPYILEMNARFGGGYPFSHLGGCNLPKAIIEWAKGNKVDPNVLQVKKLVKGYKEIIVTEE